MSEDNSNPSDENNQEHEAVEDTNPEHLGEEDSLTSEPADTEPKVPVSQIVNPELVASGIIQTPDTEPPPAASHGWLEQFDILKADAIAEIEKVAKGGLEDAEVDLLCYLSVKLAHIAQSHDSASFDKIRDHLV